MQDNPVDRLELANRVSIRAVLVSDQSIDIQAALAQAGIFDSVAIPVLLGDEADLSGGLFGDGITPNLIGILEPDKPDAHPAEPASSNPETQEHGSPTRHQPPQTANLPAAFGLKPMAPVRKRPI